MAIRRTKVTIEVEVRYRSDHISPDEIEKDISKWLNEVGIQERKPLRLVSDSTFWAHRIKVTVDDTEFTQWLWEHANETPETFGNLPEAYQNGLRQEYAQYVRRV
jgi:hypothetical protein